MADDEDRLTVDELVTGRAAEMLGEGIIPTKAVLIVETMSEAGTGLRYVMSQGLMTWHALGMLRSSELWLEQQDLESWGDDD